MKLEYVDEGVVLLLLLLLLLLPCVVLFSAVALWVEVEVSLLLVLGGDVESCRVSSCFCCCCCCCSEVVVWNEEEAPLFLFVSLAWFVAGSLALDMLFGFAFELEDGVDED